MNTLYLVRHAKTRATWGEATDPGLDATGVSQAERTADELQRRLAPLALYTSPLRRCVETAQPLASLWQTPAQLLPQVAEVPSPPLSTAERAQWLAAGMQGTWRSCKPTRRRLAELFKVARDIAAYVAHSAERCRDLFALHCDQCGGWRSARSRPCD